MLLANLNSRLIQFTYSIKMNPSRASINAYSKTLKWTQALT